MTRPRYRTPVPPRRGAWKERFVVLNGTATRLLEADGRGPTILLLHGFTDSADTWRAVMADLAAAGRRALAVDLPHHGHAGRLENVTSLAGYDPFVRAAVTHADNGSGVVLVGNSLGALLALHCAETGHPSLRSVVALAPPGSTVTPLVRHLPAVWPALGRALGSAPIPDRVLRYVAGRAFAAICVRGLLPRPERERYASHLSKERLLDLFAQAAFLAPELLAPKERPEYVVPVTLWWGSRDIVCPADSSPPSGANIRVASTEGAPHCPQFLEPELVLTLIADHEQTQETSAPDGDSLQPLVGLMSRLTPKRLSTAAADDPTGQHRPRKLRP